MTFFAPIKMVLVAVGIIVAWSGISEIYVVSKKPRKTVRCALYKRVLRRTLKVMLMLQCVVLTVYMIDNSIIGEVTGHGKNSLLLTKCAAFIIVLIESYFIDRNIRRVHGMVLLS